jgi:hypothetical protein
MIRISTFENNSFEPFKTINEESFELLKSDCKVLKDTYSQFVVFKYLQLNIKDYSKFLKEWTNVPANRMNFSVTTNVHFVLEANRLILNLLIGFKFFLDNAETYLKRKYGKDSLIVNDFKTLTSKCYDESFAYRFLSKLRNFAVHLGFPLEVIHLDIDFNKDNPEISKHSFQFILHIEKMKNEKDLFGNVYKDLENLNKDIELIPLINELTHYIIVLQKYMYRVQKESINNSIENLENIVGKHKTEKNQIKVYHNFEEQNNSVSFSVYDVPFEIIMEYKTTYKNWC